MNIVLDEVYLMQVNNAFVKQFPFCNDLFEIDKSLRIQWWISSGERKDEIVKELYFNLLRIIERVIHYIAGGSEFDAPSQTSSD